MHVVMTSAGIGRIEDGSVALLDAPYPDPSAVIEATGSLDALAEAKVVRRIPLDGETGLRAPLARPRALWGVGLNYYSKAAQTGRAVPDEPVLYLAGCASVSAPGAAVRLPAEETAQMDYEAEIAVVIGRTLDRAAEDETWSAVAAITAANDMTARDVMKRTGTPALAKSFPGFTPLGASLLGRDEVPDPDMIGVRCLVGGEPRQNSSSADMIFAIPELLARISRYAALRPGDVVLTGTPAGTGQDRDDFLRPGDTVRVEVDGVLPLITRVRA
ncbi:fumarylacetoacetate hydrolase family protein [Actinomadura sp. BRA 177]|uniref:fumarylacetoacetate hydrolase family protein n=1 Tax=Actinomadura sp. BRA 177 TaxID=2745202 RepID=UPI001596315A|nr:fumarylacetoacetate hydrolase family protein [Actinomadura sp. BRA 177]NVI85874.1 fumarylacetoacetate hydrolase family protein [Actinomadura sp. BRA 177]